jgi:hypothetical protein
VLEKEKAAQGGLLREPVMALLVLWLVVYFLIEVFRGVGAARRQPAPVGAALAVTPDEEAPIRVDWELLPAAEQAADRH